MSRWTYDNGASIAECPDTNAVSLIGHAAWIETVEITIGRIAVTRLLPDVRISLRNVIPFGPGNGARFRAVVTLVKLRNLLADSVSGERSAP